MRLGGGDGEMGKVEVSKKFKLARFRETKNLSNNILFMKINIIFLTWKDFFFLVLLKKSLGVP